ncbi:MAG: DUF5666 domain-containing protein [Thermoanaerobaculia bacterium]
MQTQQSFPLRFVAGFAIGVLTLCVPVFGQGRPDWSTAADIQPEANGSIVGTVIALDGRDTAFSLVPDADQARAKVTVNTDPVSTRFFGYGTADPGQVFSGTEGFRKIETGDRVRVDGIGRPGNAIRAERVQLLGRVITGNVAAKAPAPGTTIEGTVRTVDEGGSDLVVIDAAGQQWTLDGTPNTPVQYQGTTYHILNLEEGDVVRAHVVAAAGNSIRTDSIEVVQNVRTSAPAVRQNRTLTSIHGRVVAIDPQKHAIRMDLGRDGEVTVDVSGAVNSKGDPLRVSDLVKGDHLEISGRYAEKVFRADVVRFAGEVVASAPPPAEPPPPETSASETSAGDYELVLLYGTIEETLERSATIQVRDSDTGQVLAVLASSDFVVQTSSGGYKHADQLQRGQDVAIRAFRDPDGNLIAQTIRER